jgi:hypothetical protein
LNWKTTKWRRAVAKVIEKANLAILKLRRRNGNLPWRTAIAAEKGIQKVNTSIARRAPISCILGMIWANRIFWITEYRNPKQAKRL